MTGSFSPLCRYFPSMLSICSAACFLYFVLYNYSKNVQLIRKALTGVRTVFLTVRLVARDTVAMPLRTSQISNGYCH